MAGSIDCLPETGTMVSFGERLAHSPRFRQIFTEGMDLVEEAASYLDGPGRTDARGLRPGLGVAYSIESMRLTTRLMQIASWLLIRRAIVDGETDPASAESQGRFKITAQAVVSPATVFAQLPAPLRDLAVRSLRLQTRILHLDGMVNDHGPVHAPVPSGLTRQIELLRSAFGTAD